MFESNNPCCCCLCPGTHGAPSSLFSGVLCAVIFGQIFSSHRSTNIPIKVSNNFHLSKTDDHFLIFILLNFLAGLYIGDDLMTPALNPFFSWLPGHPTFWFCGFFSFSFFVFAHSLLLPLYLSDLYTLEFFRTQSLDCFSFLSILIPQSISFNLFYLNISLLKNSYYVSLRMLPP